MHESPGQVCTAKLNLEYQTGPCRQWMGRHAAEGLFGSAQDGDWWITM